MNCPIMLYFDVCRYLFIIFLSYRSTGFWLFGNKIYHITVDKIVLFLSVISKIHGRHLHPYTILQGKMPLL